MAEREFPQAERGALAQEGEGLPPDRYPMPDCDAVKRAQEAYGRVRHDRATLRRLIVKRHTELGCDHPLPDSWHLG